MALKETMGPDNNYKVDMFSTSSSGFRSEFLRQTNTSLTHGTTIQLHLSAIKQSNLENNFECIWEKSNGSIYREQYLQQDRSFGTTRAAGKITKSIQAGGSPLNQLFGTEQLRDFHGDRTQFPSASFYRRDECTMQLRGMLSNIR